jgi:hypothetical protein
VLTNLERDNQMVYTKDSNEWLMIRAKTGHFFSKSALAFWGSKIYWQTLTKIKDGWLFISQEDNFDQTMKLFSVRKVNKDYGIETLVWQFTADYKTAKKSLNHQITLNNENERE